MYDMLHQDALYGNYRTRYFSQIYENAESFKEDATTIGIPLLISDTNLTTLYYLLYSRYGNSPIASSDENRFKYNLFSIIFCKGPTWEKKLEVQQKIRDFTEEDLMAGSKAIYNTALNPNQAPSTATLEELPYINSQNTTNYKKTKVEGYALLMSMLEDDVTTSFLDSFKKLFNPFGSELPLYYTNNNGEDEDEL